MSALTILQTKMVGKLRMLRMVRAADRQREALKDEK